MEHLLAVLGTYDLALDAEQRALFSEYQELLLYWNKLINLTAAHTADEIQIRHFADSLSCILATGNLNGQSLIDVGSGAGFPGLPLAIAEPDRRFVLLDSNNKKIQFVQHVAGLLGLDNVTAVNARTEDYAPGERFDTVTARAVAELATLVDVAGHLVREDGVFVALKGRYPAEELEELEAPWSHEVVQLMVPGLDAGSRHAVLLRRV